MKSAIVIMVYKTMSASVSGKGAFYLEMAIFCLQIWIEFANRWKQEEFSCSSMLKNNIKHVQNTLLILSQRYALFSRVWAPTHMVCVYYIQN